MGNDNWKPSALRAAGDIDRQAADDIEFGVTISTRDGRQLVHEWHAALARAERAAAAEARLSAIPFDEIGSLASAVDDLSFGQSRSARIVLDWLSSAAPAKV